MCTKCNTIPYKKHVHVTNTNREQITRPNEYSYLLPLVAATSTAFGG